VLGLVLAAVAIAACTRPTDPDPPGRPPPPPQTPTPTQTDPSTTPTTVSGTIDCGTHTGDSGYPTTFFQVPILEGGGKCLLDAWETGTPATFVMWRGDGSGRNMVETTYTITGPGRVEVITDRSRTAPPGGVLRQECRTLAAGAAGLEVHNCVPLPPGAPPFDGKDCGLIAYASGWPTTRPVRLTWDGKCFLDAWESGTPARLVTRDQTDGQGGAILIVTYDVLGPGELRVTTDPRQTVRPGPVTTQLCTSLTHNDVRLTPADCRPAT
jgi:hypothetical protein